MMMNLHPMPSGVEAVFNKQIMARLREYAEYEADVSNWYRYGSGRPSSEGGRGWSYPYCIHGTSRHTDYDNICWQCEEGYGYWDAEREVQAAYDYARTEVANKKERAGMAVDFMAQAAGKGFTVPPELRSMLIDWATG